MYGASFYKITNRQNNEDKRPTEWAAISPKGGHSATQTELNV